MDSSQRPNLEIFAEKLNQDAIKVLLEDLKTSSTKNYANINEVKAKFFDSVTGLL